MSNDLTQELPGGSAFERQVLAQLNSINARLQALEDQAEQRRLETKPIWERALAEIFELKQNVVETKQDIRNLGRKIEVMHRDIVQVRADQEYLETRLEKLEPKPRP